MQTQANRDAATAAIKRVAARIKSPQIHRRAITSPVNLRVPHPRQQEFLDNPAKRKVIRAGRRGGKTTGMGILAVGKFMEGRRVLYAAPTSEQIAAFWWEVTTALFAAIENGEVKKNESEHYIEVPGTKQRIRAKTAWNADTLRGDYADVLILDEYQLMSEDAWERVGAPMLLDNDGDAVFIYTPPSPHSRSTTKANDPRHAAKMFKAAQADTSGRWASFHFTSHENPHISVNALDDLSKDMTSAAMRAEIEAMDDEEVPGALWKRAVIDDTRVTSVPKLKRIVVAVDPSLTSKETSDEAGIIVAGISYKDKGYVLDDRSMRGTPLAWAKEAIAAYHKWQADRLIAEQNNGGEMVELTLHTADENVPVTLITASRGKATRAEPVAALYEHGNVHHVGTFAQLEDEMCTWVPGNSSPNHMDALVWALTELMLSGGVGIYF